ncbi:hypothetical protein L596_007030 [Steinernema carpocapsae]|uniref:Transmembrane protein 200A n=1 Tax=Steinernema carpocapsae TaxID=34508 RepID=A0A4U5P8F1_STECR|nr:hypothetical protein L596_007030 [Steinernema carpocapsae]
MALFVLANLASSATSPPSSLPTASCKPKQIISPQAKCNLKSFKIRFFASRRTSPLCSSWEESSLEAEEDEEEAMERESVFSRTHKFMTLWAACRAVAFGTTIIVFGMIMAVVGYFDKDLSTYEVYDEVLQKNVTKVNDLYRIQLKSMQYIGPVVMGIGSFLLIIACVITLESRDRHAQVIQDENTEYRRLSERRVTSSNTKTSIVNGERSPVQAEKKTFVTVDEKTPESEIKPMSNGSLNGRVVDKNGTNGNNGTLLKSNGPTSAQNCNSNELFLCTEPMSTKESTVAEVHVPLRHKPSPKAVPNGRISRFVKNPAGPAPMAEMDSLLDANLSSSSSSLFLINDPFAV